MRATFQCQEDAWINRSMTTGIVHANFCRYTESNLTFNDAKIHNKLCIRYIFIRTIFDIRLRCLPFISQHTLRVCDKTIIIAITNPVVGQNLCSQVWAPVHGWAHGAVVPYITAPSEHSKASVQQQIDCIVSAGNEYA